MQQQSNRLLRILSGLAQVRRTHADRYSGAFSDAPIDAVGQEPQSGQSPKPFCGLHQEKAPPEDDAEEKAQSAGEGEGEEKAAAKATTPP